MLHLGGKNFHSYKDHRQIADITEQINHWLDDHLNVDEPIIRVPLTLHEMPGKEVMSEISNRFPKKNGDWKQLKFFYKGRNQIECALYHR